MKKFAFLFLMAAVALGFASCKDDKDEPKNESGEIALGFYILNQGNMNTKIPGSISVYDALSGLNNGENGNAFLEVNGVQIGEEANQMLTIGNRMFITVSTSNIIWAVDPGTMRIIGSIRPTGEATNPRFMAKANGRLYVSMYTGYVCEINPLTLEITRTVKVGPNPEQMGVIGNTLVVTNSDGMNYLNNYADCSLSFVDLTTFTQTELKDHNVIFNPTKCVSNGTDLFITCMGNYGNIPAKVLKVTGKTIDDIQEVCLGTSMDIAGNHLYVINNQASKQFAGTITYKVYNTTTLEEKGDFIKMTEATDSQIAYPISAFVNPMNGEIVVLSYKMDGEYAQYTAPGYANLYDKAGNFQRRIPCGVGPTDVLFVNISY